MPAAGRRRKACRARLSPAPTLRKSRARALAAGRCAAAPAPPASRARRRARRRGARGARRRVGRGARRRARRRAGRRRARARGAPGGQPAAEVRRARRRQRRRQRARRLGRAGARAGDVGADAARVVAVAPLPRLGADVLAPAIRVAVLVPGRRVERAAAVVGGGARDEKQEREAAARRPPRRRAAGPRPHHLKGWWALPRSCAGSRSCSSSPEFSFATGINKMDAVDVAALVSVFSPCDPTDKLAQRQARQPTAAIEAQRTFRDWQSAAALSRGAPRAPGGRVTVRSPRAPARLGRL